MSETENGNKLDWLEVNSKLILGDGVDVSGRMINIFGDISMKNFIKFDKHLRLLESLSEDPLTININSNGGSVYAMFAYIDRIQASPCNITMISYGFIASAALPIFCCTDKRIATEFTTFMHHSLSYEIPLSKTVDHVNELAHSKQLQSKFNKFLAKQTKKPYSFWASTGKNQDYFFDAEQALEFGVATDVNQ